MVKLGDRVLIKPETLDSRDAAGKAAPMRGEIVYIHPRGRYCTVAFKVGKLGAVVRESFKLIEGEISE